MQKDFERGRVKSDREKTFREVRKRKNGEPLARPWVVE